MALLWLLAGEASGDVLGARLMASLRRLRPDLRFAGVGGARMAAAGLKTLFPMDDLAVMGLAEILPRLPRLNARLREAVADITAKKPDLVVTIDSPGFSLRLLKRIAPLDIKRVQYVAPQVWAWREHRVKKFPGLWDELLCLLPFEPEFFAHHGLQARFTGHPVLQSGADQGDAARFRARHGLDEAAKLVVLMPGSRKTEVPVLLPVFAETMRILAAQRRDIRAVIPVSPVVADTVQGFARKFPDPPILVTDIGEKHDAYAAAGAALTKSGTSTLELALAGVPMAVTYRVNPVTAAMARRMIRVPHVTMVNLLAGKKLVPELLQENCTPEKLAAAVRFLLDDPEAAKVQRAGFAEIMATLAPPEGLPSDAAAWAVLSLIESETNPY
jgi:lipid-A-disaccharide synthase